VLLTNDQNTGGRSYVPREQAAALFREYGAVYGLRMIEKMPKTATKMVTLEHFTAIGAIDVLKLDCEGAEFDILLNTPMPLLTKCEWIVGEYHKGNGDWAAVKKRLQPWYIVFGELDRGNVGLFCFRRSRTP